jgi:hypothetical protein
MTARRYGCCGQEPLLGLLKCSVYVHCPVDMAVGGDVRPFVLKPSAFAQRHRRREAWPIPKTWASGVHDHFLGRIWAATRIAARVRTPSTPDS